MMNVVLDFLSNHISTFLFINAIFTMLPKTLDNMKHPRIRPVVRTEDNKLIWGDIYWYIDKPVGILQFLTGLITLYVTATYYSDIILAGRPPNIAMMIVLPFAGVHNFSQATRNYPWALILGVAGGSIGAYGIWSLKSTLAPTGVAPPWFGFMAILFGAIYWGIWVLTKPWEEAYQNIGKGMAWGGAAIPSAMIQMFFAVLASPLLGVMLV